MQEENDDNSNSDSEVRPESKTPQEWCFGIAIFIGSFIALDQLCFKDPLLSYFTPITSCDCWAYTGFSIAIVGILFLRFFRYELMKYDGRLEDHDVVYSSIINAGAVEPRLVLNDDKLPENYENKVTTIQKEARRLEDVGKDEWTEYQFLPIKQMLVDFLKEDDLRAESQSVLDQLKEYADSSTHRYDLEYYGKWNQRITDATQHIDITKQKCSDSESDMRNLDKATEQLRAELRTLYDHLADFQLKWTVGSALKGSLIYAGTPIIIILIVMGLVPALHPKGDLVLGVVNWGLFGAGGALTAALLSLRKSDVVEVGDTEGKREIWRAILGSGLGFVAGVLSYGIIVGGLLGGLSTPNISVLDAVPDMKQIGLSVVWAIAAGFSFEKIFERMRGSTEGGS